MNERNINITEVKPVELFGNQNKNIRYIARFYPKLKIITRGNTIKVFGEYAIIHDFEQKLIQLIKYLKKYNHLNDNAIDQIITGGEVNESNNEVIVYRNNGSCIKSKTINQSNLVTQIKEYDLVFALGPAGTGKTYIAVAMAVKALKEKMIKSIILTRPAVEAGENIGFLPGDLKEKLDPYLQPLYDALRDMIPTEKLNEYIEKETIQIAPLAFMRGRTLDNAFVILDESQNTTHAQMKMFLTRMGKSAKFIITGDPDQIDLPKNQESGLITAMKMLKGVKGISFAYLDETDVVRHPLVKKIILAYKK